MECVEGEGSVQRRSVLGECRGDCVCCVEGCREDCAKIVHIQEGGVQVKGVCCVQDCVCCVEECMYVEGIERSVQRL